ncbi:GtrA family protein [Lactovum odontotermitis]
MKGQKISFSETARYLLAGLASTLVFISLKMGSFTLLKSGVLSEIIAQVLTTLFGYFMNRTFVFKSKSKYIARELFAFSATRIFVTVLAVFLNWLLVDTHPHLLTNLLGVSLKTSVFLLSISLQIFSTVLNFLFAKFLVFREK